MAGDRLNTDILFAINSGFRSILVLSGETTEGALAASAVRPDLVLPSINEILKETE